MSLELDDRRRAMLMEMNIKVWADPRTPAPAVIAVPDSAGMPATDPSQARGPVTQAPAVAAPFASPGASPGAAFGTSPGTGARAPVARQPLPPGIDTMDWAALEAAVAGCRACNLCATRKNTVFGAGSRQADWLVVGEAPGENEDLAGEPFVGQAGTLLDNMLKAIGLARGSDAGGGTYISNVIKCRPPANRNPLPEEVAQCEPYLRRQVELLQPKIILALGRFAVQSLLQSAEPIGKMRGRVHEYHGVPVIVSYHPAYLLRSLPEKAKAWADLCLAAEVMKQRR